ncbi:hypothetical protein F2P56_021668 [Juglans regia]|uniref:Helicase MAGATAMA 3 n=1 Tax=Juglans regia TaxID=51240 RepID=A0A833TDU3_JUGRE|nr:hypothetical protein F2P56_021668 [Juglans regia]
MEKKEELDGKSLLDIVFSWSLKDVINKDIYRNQVKRIPETFLSVEEYKKSFIYPLLEETHADLFSNMTTLFQAPTREIHAVKRSSPKNLLYEITLKKTANAEEDVGKYVPEVGDLIALTDVRPMSIDDLNRPGIFYLIAYVHGAKEEDSSKENFDDKDLGKITILASKPILIELDSEKNKKETLLAVYLMNMITNDRIWRALDPELDGGNLIEKVLQANSADENCTSRLFEGKCSLVPFYLRDVNSSYNLNDSQTDAVLSCVDMRNFYHQSTVKLIWGPPGTGKTKTIGFILFSLLEMKCRTLTCAPTNIAVLEVTKRLLRSVREMQTPEHDSYGLGDILLFGNNKRMKIGKHDDLLDVFLDHRVDMLYNCFLPSTGWKNSLESMISLLDDPESQYNRYLESIKKYDDGNDDKLKKEESDGNLLKDDVVPMTFEEYFKNICESLELCMVNLYTHLPTSQIQLEVAKNMIRARVLLKTLETMLDDAHISDAQNVKQRSYEKRFLQGKMYSSYSFISIAHGKEERGHNYSSKNMVEAAVVSEIVSKLFKRFLDTRNPVSIGVISPYKAQVYAIEEQIRKYKTHSDSGFSVSARSVDGFQGGEEDVIIISTVRCNENGSVGFLSNRQRANVALTRARYCLWILGDEFTLLNSGSVWKKLVLDAKERECFHKADEDKSLAQAIIASLVELGQFDTLLHDDSLLFREATWKVFFNNAFGRSMARIRNAKICKEVLSMLTKLASGWRPPQVKRNPIALHGRSSQLLEIYKIKGQLRLYLLWTVDIIIEDSNYIQVMNVLDVLPLSDVLKLPNHVDILFRSYTEDKMQRCKHKCVLGNLIVPMRWPVDPSSSCAEPDAALYLSRPLSLLSLREEPETSTASTYRNRFQV